MRLLSSCSTPLQVSAVRVNATLRNDALGDMGSLHSSKPSHPYGQDLSHNYFWKQLVFFKSLWEQSHRSLPSCWDIPGSWLLVLDASSLLLLHAFAGPGRVCKRTSPQRRFGETRPPFTLQKALSPLWTRISATTISESSWSPSSRFGNNLIVHSPSCWDIPRSLLLVLDASSLLLLHAFAGLWWCGHTRAGLLNDILRDIAASLHPFQILKVLADRNPAPVHNFPFDQLRLLRAGACSGNSGCSIARPWNATDELGCHSRTCMLSPRMHHTPGAYFPRRSKQVAAQVGQIHEKTTPVLPTVVNQTTWAQDSKTCSVTGFEANLNQVPTRSRRRLFR